jgi:hypothetical protein
LLTRSDAFLQRLGIAHTIHITTEKTCFSTFAFGKDPSGLVHCPSRRGAYPAAHL